MYRCPISRSIQKISHFLPCFCVFSAYATLKCSLCYTLTCTLWVYFSKNVPTVTSSTCALWAQFSKNVPSLRQHCEHKRAKMRPVRHPLRGHWEAETLMTLTHSYAHDDHATEKKRAWSGQCLSHREESFLELAERRKHADTKEETIFCFERRKRRRQRHGSMCPLWQRIW